jgi:hypothetical protein
MIPDRGMLRKRITSGPMIYQTTMCYGRKYACNTGIKLYKSYAIPGDVAETAVGNFFGLRNILALYLL